MVINIDNYLLKIAHDYLNCTRKKSSQMRTVKIETIKEFYICPEECGNKCCKNIRFGLLEEDVKNISKSGIEGKEYIRKIQKSGKMCYYPEVNKTAYYMEGEVCLFLKISKCGLLSRYKPMYCKQFPFMYISKDQMNALKMCPIGRDIAIDIDIAGFLFWHNKDPGNTDPKLCKVIEYYNNLHKMPEEDAFDEIVKVNTNEPLNLLLCYLESTSPEDRILMRKSFLNGNLVEALKNDERLITWEIKLK